MDRVAFLARLRERLSSAAPQEGAAPAAGLPQPPDLAGRELVDLFVERLRAAGANAHVVASLDHAREALEGFARERGWASVAGARSLAWAAGAIEWTVEAGDAPFGLCEADWAVAETGTVVVRSSADVRRGYSLVPPVIGFFVPRRRILRTMGDVLRELPADAGGLPSCVSFISGPSSTADLAAVHVVGVHGPGEVFVWVIEDGARGSR